MNATQLITEPTRPLVAPVEPHRTFDTFADAWNYTLRTAQTLQTAGRAIIAAKRWQDRLKKYRPRDLQSKVLGFGRKAVNDCERLAPGGKWTVMVEDSGGYQFSVAYSKFLPYAYAMMRSENGYNAFGLDFQSIFSHFGTCLGYGWIGMGQFPNHDEADLKLYDEIQCASREVKMADLPFDEVFRPAFCYVFVRSPHLISHFISDRERLQQTHIYQHTLKVVERLGNKLPALLKAA